MRRDTGKLDISLGDQLATSRRTCLDNPVIAEHLEAIRALGREYGVLRLEVFGSVCTPAFDPERSDVDFLVEYPDDYDFGLWLTRHFELKDRLESLLERQVDLVMVDAPRNKYFAKAIDETRQLLYAA
jgi:predicted nucleotidyltransferase